MTAATAAAAAPIATHRRVAPGLEVASDASRPGGPAGRAPSDRDAAVGTRRRDRPRRVHPTPRSERGPAGSGPGAGSGPARSIAPVVSAPPVSLGIGVRSNPARACTSRIISANSTADSWRWAGSLASARRRTRSSPGGAPGRSSGGGSSVRIRRTVVVRSGPANGVVPAISWYSVAASEYTSDADRRAAVLEHLRRRVGDRQPARRRCGCARRRSSRCRSRRAPARRTPTRRCCAA